ncbi:phosphatase PAP2 family protein, partial [Streptomyces cyaneofuscatus]
MAGLELEGSNPDVSVLYGINGLAKAAPTWLDRVMEFVGEYGTMFGLVLVGLWCWWSMRKRGSAEDSVSTVAALVWAPLAAALAVVINIPIRGLGVRAAPGGGPPGGGGRVGGRERGELGRGPP